MSHSLKKTNVSDIHYIVDKSLNRIYHSEPFFKLLGLSGHQKTYKKLYNKSKILPSETYLFTNTCTALPGGTSLQLVEVCVYNEF